MEATRQIPGSVDSLTMPLEALQLSWLLYEPNWKAFAGLTLVMAVLLVQGMSEDATRKAEELVYAASTRVQAAARGRLVRREKDLVKKSTITLQRALRRLKHRRQGKKADFSAVVAAATDQRKEWAVEFERAAEHAFAEALLRSCPMKVSQVQAEKLWAGFLEHSEVPGPMAISTFWAICEAVEQGEEQAADFADIPVEENLDFAWENFSGIFDTSRAYQVVPYACYGSQATPQAEEQMRAAQRIQAAQRGRQARRQHQSQAEKQKAACAEAALQTEGLVTVVQGSLIGSILSNLLLVLGMAFLAAGFVQKESVFNEMGAAANDVLEVSRASSGIVAAAYICFLVFQLCTHSEMFAGEDEDEEEANLGLCPAIMILLLATVPA
eukprot:s7692_g1.t1